MARVLSAFALVLLLAFPPLASAQVNPTMSGDFQNMMQWLSHSLAQGLGFFAGESFDPPHEVTDKRIQPDLSLGVGHLPLNKSQFPTLQVQALNQLNLGNVFPEAINFPNLAMHLRGGLPYRMDFAVRGANMTTPPGYQISSGVPAKGQSNSIGVGLRKHFFGGEDPLLSLGVNFNHVYGIFHYNTKFAIDAQGFNADTAVNGSLQWNVNSAGVNAVVSDTFFGGRVTPFFGFGINRVSGSVSATLQAIPNTPLINQIYGSSAERPEQNQGRLIFGSESNMRYVHMFFNGEVKAIGIGSGKTYIISAGAALPFHIGMGGGAAYSSSRTPSKTRDRFQDTRETSGDYSPHPSMKEEKATSYAPVPPPWMTMPAEHKEIFDGKKGEKAKEETPPQLIFLQ
jgi:hypothetical protein